MGIETTLDNIEASAERIAEISVALDEGQDTVIARLDDIDTGLDNVNHMLTVMRSILEEHLSLQRTLVSYMVPQPVPTPEADGKKQALPLDDWCTDAKVQEAETERTPRLVTVTTGFGSALVSDAPGFTCAETETMPDRGD